MVIDIQTYQNHLVYWRVLGLRYGWNHGGFYL